MNRPVVFTDIPVEKVVSGKWFKKVGYAFLPTTCPFCQKVFGKGLKEMPCEHFFGWHYLFEEHYLAAWRDNG